MWDLTPDVYCGLLSSGRSAPEGLGTCVWEYDGQAWRVKLLRDAVGVPGEPPQVPGRFRGQLRAMPCVAETSRA